jgi:hypothetical protein
MPTLPAYAYLPQLLGELKALVPRLQAATHKPGARLPPTLLAQLLHLLAQLPSFTSDDRLPPLPYDFMPPLTLTAKGTAVLSLPLITKLNLRAGQPAHLFTSHHTRSPYWYLDLRPSAPHNIDWYPGKKPKIKGLQLPEGLLEADQHLTLLLVPGEPQFADIYPLLPAGPLASS